MAHRTQILKSGEGDAGPHRAGMPKHEAHGAKIGRASVYRVLEAG
jgi:hypothetical protein